MIKIRDLTPELESKINFESKRRIEQSAVQVQHEMMAPLQCIEFFSEKICGHKLIDEQIKYQARIIKNTTKLCRINCEDLLDFQRIETRNFQLYQTSEDLKYMVNEVLEIMKYQAQPKSIKLEFSFESQYKDMNFQIDKNRIQQVLINLLSNAIKFSQKGSIVKLQIDIWPPPESEENKYNDFLVIFQVIDYGIGINQNELSEIFKENFVTENIESQKMNPNSNGLGLRISKAIIHSMQGCLDVESELNQGSIFTVKLNLIGNSQDCVQAEKQNRETGGSIELFEQADSLKSSYQNQTFDQIQQDQNKKIKNQNSSGNSRRNHSQSSISGSSSSRNRSNSKRESKKKKPRQPKNDEQFMVGKSEKFFSGIRMPRLPNQQFNVKDNLSVKLKEQKQLILIADDNQVFIDVISSQLTELNLISNSEFFFNGQEVVNRVEQFLDMIPERQQTLQPFRVQPIKTLILDFMMPMKNGLQTIHDVKALYQKRVGNVKLDEPVYVITTSLAGSVVQNTFKRHCLNQGADFVLMKPISASKLKEIVGTNE